jgi:hypothetical protein
VKTVVLCNLAPLRVRLFLMLFVMAMVGVEEICELSNLMLNVHGLDMRIPQLGMLQLLLDFFYFLGRMMIEGMEELLKPFLPLSSRHVRGRA